MPKNKPTIAEISSKHKLTIRSGRVVGKVEIVKWTMEERQKLLDLMATRTVSAIRKELWKLMREQGKTWKDETKKN